MQRTILTTRLASLRSIRTNPFITFTTTNPRSLSTVSPSTPSEPSSPVASGSSVVGGSVQGEPESKYFVPRSQFGELPVYSDVRNSGTRVLTVVRKVHGDVSELHKDLSRFLHPSTQLYTKPQTQQVVIRGDWVREVKEWLASRGF
ncbi:mitochondrial 54S ribosomal protein mL49 IMG2 [Sporobolomyces koalae]|uniref:mitochondrial 54S ribosomal protein mL49 IMG2 n=1 Tax=Sporobolomyces koalae TaxID=500713 RepID=UPI003173ECAD